MTGPTATSTALCWLVLGGLVAVGQTPPPEKKADKIPDAPAVDPKLYATKDVRGMKGTNSVGIQYRGVVESINEEKMVFVGMALTGPPQKEEYRFTLYPINMLTDGKVLPDVMPREAYRWQDVKVGDTLNVHVKEDSEELRRYVSTIHISRRPGDKLPRSQNMKYPGWLDQDNIDNGLDVTDEEIAKVFPPKWLFDKGQPPKLIRPGGLPKEYLVKLSEVRAKLEEKKEKDLKAKPPEKK